MKKYLYILISLMAVACIASCEKEKTSVDTAKNISVVSSNLSFDNNGGTGTIVVEAIGVVTAVADKTWAQTSVNGKTITVTCEPWDKLESRNAKITLTCAGESLDITAIQTGVIFAVDDMPINGDFIISNASDTHTYGFSSNADIEVFTDTEWLTVSFDNVAKTIQVVSEENTEMATRHGSFTVKVGESEKTYKVSQYPPFTETTDWVVSLGERGEETTTLKSTVKVQHGYYAVDYALPGAVNRASSVAEFVSGTLVPKIRAGLDETIAYYNYRYGYTSFLSRSSDSWTFDLIPDGNYIGFMVGFDSEGYPTGWYGATEVFIGELTPYAKWLGNWTVPNANKTSGTETWTIEQNKEDETFWITGINGMPVGAFAENDFRAEAKFDAATQELVFAVWENTSSTWTDSSRGVCNTLLSGQYTNVAGSRYYNSGVGNVIARLKLSEDGSTATITPGSVTSGGAAAYFDNIRWYGRYTTSSGSRSGFSWTGYETPISAGMVITKE